MNTDLPTPAAAPADTGELNDAAKAAFLAHWPNDQWERFRPGDYVVQQYTAIARAVLTTRDVALRATIAEISAKLVEAVQEREIADQHANIMIGAGEAHNRTKLKLAAAEARCAELEAALRPLVASLPGHVDLDDLAGHQKIFALDPFWVCDLRRARAVLPADGQPKAEPQVPVGAFPVGTPVEKVTGDYGWRGEVRAAFTQADGGPLRYVVAHKADRGHVLHIYGPQQLVALPADGAAQEGRE